jgi:hypothetical protein
MSIQTAWTSPERATWLYTVKDQWRWADLQAALGEARQANPTNNAPLSVIIDLRAGVMGEGPLWQGKWVLDKVYTREDRVIFVGAPPFMKAMFNAFRRLYPTMRLQVFFVPSVEEAYTLVGLLNPPASQSGAPTWGIA